MSSIYPRHKIDDATLRINDMDAGFQVICDNHGANSINDDPTFQRQDNSINDGYLPKVRILKTRPNYCKIKRPESATSPRANILTPVLWSRYTKKIALPVNAL